MSESTAFTDHRDRKKQAQRGKSAEQSVKDYFKRVSERLGVAFDWERVPDARAAGGRFTPVTGDFRAFYGGRSAAIEVKETKRAGALPKTNFSRGSIARCYRRWRAGVITVILVHLSTTDAWVIMPITLFFEKDVPSWPTEGHPTFKSAEEALDFGLGKLFNSI